MAKQTLRYGSIPIKQHDYVLYLFSAPAKVLFDILAINERDPDKDEGYQRALSTSRVRSISDFVDRRRTIAPAIVVSLKKGAKFDKDSGELLIPNQPNSGWVIDGQHRLVGAAKASKDITLAVVAFIDMDIDDQVWLCCMKTGGAVLPPVSCDLCFFGYRIGLGFGQRPHPVEHGTAHPCFGLLVG